MAAETDPIPDPSPQEGISLDELARAFAEVMGSVENRPSPIVGGAGGEGPRTGCEAASGLTGSPPGPDAAQPEQSSPPGEAVRPGEAAEAPPAALPAEPLDGAADSPAEEPDSCPISPQSILEAMLFVGDRANRALEPRAAAELMRGVEPEEIPGLVRQLNRRYEAHGCPYVISDEGAGYRMTLRRPFHYLRDRFFGRIREARLSQAAIDVLAIIAYQQPLTAEQVATLRGKPSGPVLAQLVHRGLLRIERQPERRRVAQYSTTDRFLRLFGLESLADLPQSEELGE